MPDCITITVDTPKGPLNTVSCKRKYGEKSLTLAGIDKMIGRHAKIKAHLSGTPQLPKPSKRLELTSQSATKGELQVNPQISTELATVESQLHLVPGEKPTYHLTVSTNDMTANLYDVTKQQIAAVASNMGLEMNLDNIKFKDLGRVIN